MNIRVENQGACRKLIKIDAPVEAVKDEFSSVVKAFAKAARIPGFRKGKCPIDLVEKQYAAQIEEEVKERMLPILYREAVDKKGIKTVSIVEISEVEFDAAKGIAFSVAVDVYPEFKIPKYKKISLKKKVEKVAEKDVDETVSRLLENFAKYEDVEGRAVKADDLVMLDYTSECEGKNLEDMAVDAKGIGEGEDSWMMVGEPELAPGFTENLKGMNIGDKKDISIHFPDDYRVSDIAGKEAVYHVEVKGLRTKVMPELDEELFKSLQVESADDLRKRIREDLEAERVRMDNERLKAEITQTLISKTSFDLPESIVHHETVATTKSMQDRMALQEGRTTAQIEQEKDSLMETARKTSEDRVRLSYILAAIADAEEIESEEADLTERLRLMGMRYGMTPAQLRSELEKRDGLAGIKEELRAEKTLNFILENAKIK